MWGRENFEKMLTTLFKNASQGAATTVWAAVSPHFEGKNGGRFLEDSGEAAPVANAEDMTGPGYRSWAYDEEAEAALWRVSNEVVGTKDE